MTAWMYRFFAKRRGALLIGLAGAGVIATIFLIYQGVTAQRAIRQDSPGVIDLSKWTMLPLTEFLPAMIRLSQSSPGRDLADQYPELLNLFAGYYTHEIGERQRLALERHWFARPVNGTPEAWLRVIALYAAGLPEVALSLCSDVLAEETSPEWRELFWDAWLTLLLKRLPSSPDEAGAGLALAAAEVSEQTLEHMTTQLLFSGPLNVPDGESRQVFHFGSQRFDADFADAAVAAAGAAMQAPGARGAFELYQAWRGMWDTAIDDTTAQRWDRWVEALRRTPDGPALQAALQVLPETLLCILHTSIHDTNALFTETTRFLEDMEQQIRHPRVIARVELARAYFASVSGKWDEARALRASAADRMTHPAWLPWLENVAQWQDVRENEAWDIFIAMKQGDQNGTREMMEQQLRNYPFGKVSWKFYETVSHMGCVQCSPSVFDAAARNEVLRDLPPPEPAWPVEVLANAPFLCGMQRRKAPPVPQCPEPLMHSLMRLARNMDRPAIDRDANLEEALSPIAQAIQQSDAQGVTQGLYNLFEAGVVEEPRQALGEAALQSLLSMKEHELAHFLKTAPPFSFNPRAAAMHAVALCAQSCVGLRPKTEALTQAHDFLREYFAHAAAEFRSRPMDDEWARAKAVALAQTLLIADELGALDREAASLAEECLSLGSPNPWAARLLWPLALRQLRAALATDDILAARYWLERFDAVTEAVQAAGLFFAETESAMLMSDRLALVLR